MIIDTHAHIIDDKYSLSTRELVARANAEGVTKIIHIGCEISEIEPAIKCSEDFANVYIGIGIHPIYACSYDKEAEDLLIKNIENSKVVAIGECGLDYHWKTSTKEEQFYAFKRQIALAIKYDKPLIIHTRDAIQDTYDILKEYSGKVRGVIHCYSGSIEMANAFIKLGFYISLGGPVTYKNAKYAKEVAMQIDLNYLLVETDCPYLSPEPLRGQINEPAHTKIVVEYIAKLREVAFTEIANITTANALKLFQIK